MLDPVIYAQRRQLLSERLTRNYAILAGNPPMRYSNDKFFRYRPNTDLIYFIGKVEQNCIAVITSNNRVILFVQPRDPHYELWEGRFEGVDGSKEKYRADEVYPLDQFTSWLESINSSDDILTNHGTHPEVDAVIQETFPEYEDRSKELYEIIHAIRIIKSEEEIDFITQSQEISIQAHLTAIACTRPGLTERIIEGIYNLRFAQHGAILPTHAATIASGDNGLILHYRGGVDDLEDGDLLLVDTGCEFQYYTSDIARTWPINGKFSDAQAEVYTIVLDTQKACLSLLQPGVTYNEIHTTAVERLSKGLLHLGVLNGEIDDIIKKNLYKPYFPHGIGHWLGIDTHDCPTYDRSTAVLQPGMLLTIEPGLYLHHHENVPEKYRGIAIRIEDNVLITEDGYINLSEKLPKEIDEIENLVGSQDMIPI